MDTLAEARLARLSESTKWFDANSKFNSCSGECCVFLGTSVTRSGEKSSPKRDVVVKSLLNARSGEVGWLRRG